MNKRARIMIVSTALSLLMASTTHAEWWEWSEDNWMAKANVTDDGERFGMAFMKPPTEIARATGRLTREGTKFTLHRDPATDTNQRSCTYTGNFEPDGKHFSGNYTCNPGNTSFPFRGKVLSAGETPSFVVCEAVWDIKELNSDKRFDGFGASEDAAIAMARGFCQQEFSGFEARQRDCLPPPKVKRCN